MKTADRISHAILEGIVAGDYPVCSELPSEGTLAERFGVSRLTIRESTRELASLGVIAVKQGRRNRIAPTSEWSVLSSAVVSAMARITDTSATLLEDLLESRRVIEVSVARLAASRIADAQLDTLHDTITAMTETRIASSQAALEMNVKADITFHETILEAAGNVFLSSIYAPLREVLEAVRLRTSSSVTVRTEALAHHSAIYDALRARDPEAAARAMSAHMDQTLRAHAHVDLAAVGLDSPSTLPTH